MALLPNHPCLKLWAIISLSSNKPFLSDILPKDTVYFILFMCSSYMDINSGTLTGKRKLSDPLELELQVIVSPEAWNWTRVLCKSSGTLNYLSISPAPVLETKNKSPSVLVYHMEKTGACPWYLLDQRLRRFCACMHLHLCFSLRVCVHVCVHAHVYVNMHLHISQSVVRGLAASPQRLRSMPMCMYLCTYAHFLSPRQALNRRMVSFGSQF